MQTGKTVGWLGSPVAAGTEIDALLLPSSARATLRWPSKCGRHSPGRESDVTASAPSGTGPATTRSAAAVRSGAVDAGTHVRSHVGVGPCTVLLNT